MPTAAATVPQIPRNSSVPRHEDGSERGDLGSARTILVVQFGERGSIRARALLDREAPAVPVEEIHLDGLDELDVLESALQRCRVGVRIVLAGSETEVYAARARALSAGAVEDELLLEVTDVERRRVYCAHCRTLSSTRSSIGATIPCRGCGRSLVVYHHFSRELSAYLGYMADAEVPR